MWCAPATYIKDRIYWNYPIWWSSGPKTRRSMRSLRRVRRLNDPGCGAYPRRRAQIAAPMDAPITGDAFVSRLTLAGLRAFYTTNSLYNGKAQLKALLVEPKHGKPCSARAGDFCFRKYREARNAVARYELSTEQLSKPRSI